MYTTPLPLQIVAHSKVALRAMDESYKAQFRCGALDDRLHELVRLRSAQLGACEPCSMSRKDETVTDDQVACLVDPDPSVFSRREVLALQFLDLLATDHHAVDDDTFRQLATEFSAEEIVELGWICASAIGVHRFMHALDVLGDGEPIVRASEHGVKQGHD
jgi:alkylhydroperoxidase family enzyme